ncbi:hypothetical protein RESH_00206 [Rhodopirellula europaea SH398]|uniref:Uncharacterized protein n=1 Tax=Rhodopirellula europaea SH398 TaxID=1263868 RepID=M5SBR5_9BACT|nr:hypothetical protein RESH_00206 [Rhodopirellula europaea SH398]
MVVHLETDPWLKWADAHLGKRGWLGSVMAAGLGSSTREALHLAFHHRVIE